jgi:hypothetical protein
MAPLFDDAFRPLQPDLRVPKRMFQRRLSTMAETVDLQESGEFLLLPNPALTGALLARAIQKPATGDLVEVCSHWYRPTPRRVDDRLTMGSDDGSTRTLQLKLPQLSGAW